MAKTVRKTHTLTNTEINLIEAVKDKALSSKLVLNDSQIVRMGIHLVSKLSIDKLIKANKEIPDLSRK